VVLTTSRLKRKLSFLRRQEPRKIFRVVSQGLLTLLKNQLIYRFIGLLRTYVLVFSWFRLRIPAPDQVEGDVPSQA
jgi:hypothetical protein